MKLIKSGISETTFNATCTTCKSQVELTIHDFEVGKKFDHEGDSYDAVGFTCFCGSFERSEAVTQAQISAATKLKEAIDKMQPHSPTNQCTDGHK